MAAGCAWARGELGRTRRSEAEDDARRWGLKRAPGRRRDAPEAGIWRQHVPALQAYLAVAGQWRTVFVAVSPPAVGRIVALGLDYAAARAGLALAGIEVSPEAWAQVRAIEAGAMEAMNEQR